MALQLITQFQISETTTSRATLCNVQLDTICQLPRSVWVKLKLIVLDHAGLCKILSGRERNMRW